MGRSGAILVVDDEPALLNMFQQYLSRVGYEVVACAGADHALRVFRKKPGAFSLVLADITMPGISGEDLAREVLEADPGISVVLCSGYAYVPLRIALEREPRVRFLQKPFLPRTLLATVREMLA